VILGSTEAEHVAGSATAVARLAPLLEAIGGELCLVCLVARCGGSPLMSLRLIGLVSELEGWRTPPEGDQR